MDAAASEAPKTRSAPRTSVAHAWITADVRALVDREAQKRRTHPDRLVADLVTDIFERNLVAAILDH